MQISKEALNFKSQVQNLCKVQNLCICGFLIALYVVLSLFNIPISEIIEIRIGFLAFIAAGMIGGPVMGFTVGFLGDVLNCFIRGFAYFPGFSLSYALVGALCGLVLYRSRISKARAAACAFVEFLISVTLTSTWLYFMYGTPLSVLLTSRLIKCTVNFFVNIVIIYVFLEAFQRILHVAMPARR
ncbi:MAG: folate family ECF transporter S component [Lachnospiraceae bacterium]|nr:folate family ECF transporter S component [Lachnospiraceae bacterium]